MTFDLVPGRVVANVFEHVLGAEREVPCFTWVTAGLRTFGQKELAITIPRAQAASDGAEDPLTLLRTIARLAEQGRIVDDGDFTELGASRLFGRPHLRGIAYQASRPMDGVTMPVGTLTAIALAHHEIDTVKRYGALRVLARIGRAYRFFPTAPWWDLDRGPVAPPETKTILDGVACGRMTGVSAVLEGDRVVVRVPRSIRSVLARSPLPPSQVPVAFLTTLDPSADACLVWGPGQTAPEAISAPGATGACISGCFVLFVPQQQADGANPFEDGIACTLTDASWARVREALTTGASITIPGHQSLSIEWFEPHADA